MYRSVREQSEAQLPQSKEDAQGKAQPPPPEPSEAVGRATSEIRAAAEKKTKEIMSVLRLSVNASEGERGCL